MKRAERRGALESASASQHALLMHRSSISHQVQPYSPHPASVSHFHTAPRIHAQDTIPVHAQDHVNRGRAASRQDTLVIDAHGHVPQHSTERVYYHDRDVESDRDSRAESRRSASTSRYRDHRPLSPPDSSVSRDHRSNHYTDEHQSPSTAREHAQHSTLQLHPSTVSNRRPPTPPYITSISTHEQQLADSNSSLNSRSHTRPTLSVARSAPRQNSRASTEELVDGDGDDDGDGDEDNLDVDPGFTRGRGSGRLPSRSYRNGTNIPRVATLDDRSTSSRWSNTVGSAHHLERGSSRIDNQSRDQDQDELDSDMDGDVELDASPIDSGPASRPRSVDTLGRDGKNATVQPESGGTVMKTED